jgi:hypothetical protein
MQSSEKPQSRLAWAIATAPNSPFLWSHEHQSTPLKVLIAAAQELGEPPEPDTLDIPNLDITWSRLERGLRIMLAFDPDISGPIAWVFFYWCGAEDKSYVEILDSYVKTSYRRQGVRTRINQAFFECWKAEAIVTGYGTKGYGEPFMKASGYVQDELGRWMLTREAWEALRQSKEAR